MSNKKEINPLFLVAAIILFVLIIVAGRPLAQAKPTTTSPTLAGSTPETREIILEGLNQTEFENQKARNALDEAIKGEEILKKQLEQYEKGATPTPFPL